MNNYYYFQFEFGDPQEKQLQNIFNKFKVFDPKERKSSTVLIAEALKVPLAEFKTLPWKKLLQKFDKYSINHWMAEVSNAFVKVLLYCNHVIIHLS